MIRKYIVEVGQYSDKTPIAITNNKELAIKLAKRASKGKSTYCSTVYECIELTQDNIDFMFNEYDHCGEVEEFLKSQNFYVTDDSTDIKIIIYFENGEEQN